MGQRDKVGFKLGRRQVNALFQHAVEVDAEGIQITGSGRCVIRNGFIVKEYGEHGTEAVALHRHTCFFCRALQAANQNGCVAFKRCAYIVFFHVGKVGNTGSHSQRVAA